MARQNQASAFPYMLLCATLASCVLFFGVMLWQGAANGQDRADLLYAPGFVVQADVVRVVRLVPLAGSVLRSPSVDMEAEAAVVRLAR